MDPQVQQRMLIYAGLIPGAISLVLLLSAWYLHALAASRVDLHEPEYEEDADEPTSRRAVGDGPRWIMPLLMLLGVAGADYASNYTFTLWPDSNSDRFTHAIALIALMGIAEGLVRLPVLLAMLMRFVAYAGAFWMLSEGYIPGVFASSTELITYTLLAATTTTLIATSADTNAELRAEKSHAWVDAVTWIVILGLLMPVMLKNHFGIGAMLPAGLISVLIPAVLVSMMFRSLRLSRGGISVLTGFVMTMLVGSLVQTGADHLPSVLMIASLPLVTTIRMRTNSGINRLVARMLIVAAIGASALVTLYAAIPDEPDPYSDDRYQLPPDPQDTAIDEPNDPSDPDDSLIDSSPAPAPTEQP